MLSSGADRPLQRAAAAQTPTPMSELPLNHNTAPPHLHGYFEPHRGLFQLTVLRGLGPRLEGTTWYSHTMWPEQYWRLWADYVIHRIHLRVLRHIKRQAEALPR